MEFPNDTSIPSANDWFAIDRPRIVHFYNGTNQSWPWMNLTIDQYRDLYEHSLFVAEKLRFSRWIIIQILFILGFLGNLMVLITVLHIKRRTYSCGIFFSVIAAIGVFHLVFVTVNMSRRFVKDPQTQGAVIYYCIACGLGIFSSSMSDMLTLSLATDRVIALSYSMFYQEDNRRLRIFVWICLVVCSLLVSSLKFHVSFENFYYTSPYVADEAWFESLVYFSDVVTPFLIAGLMVPLAIAVFILMMRKNRKQSRFSLSLSTSSQDLHLKATQHISLFIVLLCTYFTNQLGYLIYSCLSIWLGDFSLNFESSLSEIEYYVWVSIWFEVANWLGDLLEWLSRSVVFYAYCICNGDFFMNFIRALSCLLEMILFHCCIREN